MPVKTKFRHGWLAGLSYQIPEYALKTAITYRSKINHQSITRDVSAQALRLHLLLKHKSPHLNR
jgi:long-chain fatty acid transport protein